MPAYHATDLNCDEINWVITDKRLVFGVVGSEEMTLTPKRREKLPMPRKIQIIWMLTTITQRYMALRLSIALVC